LLLLVQRSCDCQRLLLLQTRQWAERPILQLLLPSSSKVLQSQRCQLCLCLLLLQRRQLLQCCEVAATAPATAARYPSP
jgi:hypothetical protein